MSNRTQAILHLIEARAMMTKALMYLQEDAAHDTEDIREARAALKAAWQAARGNPQHKIETSAKWLNQVDNAILAGAAGFPDILEAAAWLDKEVLA